MERKEYVDIYCKIYTDTFSDDMNAKKVTGDQVYDFLMRDSNHTFDEGGNPLKGDLNLWYLGCNEKFGSMTYKTHQIEWSFGESSFDNVQKFVDIMAEDNFITPEQYMSLNEKIEEGRLIDNMYDITLYLHNKTIGKPWTKTPDSQTFRQDMKKLMETVEGFFSSKKGMSVRRTGS